MSSQEAKTDRLVIFSDGVFAVLITILVLDLKPPESATFAAFHALWPAAISYAISYLFIAIVWVNHHHLLRFANDATPLRLRETTGVWYDTDETSWLSSLRTIQCGVTTTVYRTMASRAISVGTLRLDYRTA